MKSEAPHDRGGTYLDGEARRKRGADQAGNRQSGVALARLVADNEQQYELHSLLMSGIDAVTALEPVSPIGIVTES